MTLELILMLPVWIVLLLAVIEFGMLIASRQQVALASRVGAEEASETAGLWSIPPGSPVPPNVLAMISQQLASSDISACRVILEHNLTSPGFPPSAVPVVLSSGACDCPVPSPPPSAPRAYVRVTVYVALTELAPNLLSNFGFDISDKFIKHSTTFRHEL